MTYFWPIVIIAIMIMAGMLLLQMFTRSPSLPYHRKPRLVTNTELKFYGALRQAIRDELQIFAMVRIADLLAVDKGTKKRQSWFNKIAAKHIDFVLCDPDTLEVRVAIELDDSSHDRPDRKKRDVFVNAAFDSADLPLLRIKTEKSYDVRDLRKMIGKIT